MKIDLNADLGEGYGPWKMGDDEALLDVITSANVACGYHAGDPVIMDRVVRAAAHRGIDVGAHVGFPDLLGFGRRQMQADPAELSRYVLYQLGALAAIAKVAGTRVGHLSFHGALGNMSAVDYQLAAPMVQAVAAFDPSITICATTDTQIEVAARECGLRVANAFLADRAYENDGTLVSRKKAGAVIESPAAVLARVEQLIADGTVTTIDGQRLAIDVQQILVHGDTPGAVDLARAVRRSIESHGGEVAPLSALF
ncbi:LamB/YcsF family protein [Robbsia sp. Bb-Pol-6]|uniref:5-oxoprolinase subunit A n=1 Tax=Robbsia betulipollinis TaxID=2981849 RepID=A0ABT3ZHG5_9BURK|nr:5-oxoprolinase subunit PxpA [Robbsia betulipollinis]MCY0385902.1 LamB/YcsF family protein [Robbsia betulipollinis]